MSIAGLFTNKGLQQIGCVYWDLLSLNETHPFLVCLTQTQKHQNGMCLAMLLGMLHAKKGSPRNVYVYWVLLSLSETHPCLLCLTQNPKHKNEISLPIPGLTLLLWCKPMLLGCNLILLKCLALLLWPPCGPIPLVKPNLAHCA